MQNLFIQHRVLSSRKSKRFIPYILICPREIQILSISSSSNDIEYFNRFIFCVLLGLVPILQWSVIDIIKAMIIIRLNVHISMKQKISYSIYRYEQLKFDRF